MAALVLLVLFSAFIHGSDGAWCVCRSDVSQSMQQKALDYACGAGADCTPILQNGGCYNPNTVLAHCSYAANSYFQRKGQAAGSCDFSATATVTATDPSYSGCTHQAPALREQRRPRPAPSRPTPTAASSAGSAPPAGSATTRALPPGSSSPSPSPSSPCSPVLLCSGYTGRNQTFKGRRGCERSRLWEGEDTNHHSCSSLFFLHLFSLCFPLLPL